MRAVLARVLGEQAMRPAVFAQFVSITGTAISGLALPTLAVLVLDAGPLQAALLFALGYGARGLTAPLLGVLVDAVASPRRLLIGADAVQVAVILTVPVAYGLDALTLWLLFAVAAISGSLDGLTEICVQATVPRLSEPERLVQANSALAGARAAGQITGPGLAGLLVQAFGGALSMVADAVSYLLSAVLFARLRPAPRTAGRSTTAAAAEVAEPETAGSPSRAQQGFVAALRQGGQVLRGRPVLIRLALASAALNLGGAGIGGLFVLYAYRSLGLSPAAVGLTAGVYSVMAIVAVSTATQVIARLGMERTIPVLAPVAAAALLLIPAAGLVAPLPTLIVYEAVFGYCATVWMIATLSLQQSIVPADSLGRVIALTRSVSMLAIPVGALGGGVAAEAYGTTATLTGFALVSLAGTATVLVRPAAYRAPVTEPQTTR